MNITSCRYAEDYFSSENVLTFSGLLENNIRILSALNLPYISHGKLFHVCCEVRYLHKLSAFSVLIRCENLYKPLQSIHNLINVTQTIQTKTALTLK